VKDFQPENGMQARLVSAEKILTLDLGSRRAAAVARGVSTATPLFAARASNAEIWDSEGRRYLDFAGGIGVLATGHRHPRVMSAVCSQLEHFTHTAFQVMAYEPYVHLAERLNSIAPFKGPARSLLLTTGAEAVENAVKIARVATGRSAVISFSGAFHGRTQLTLSLTGKMLPYKRGLTGGAHDVFRIPFPIEHRGQTAKESLAALDALFHTDIEPAQVAAIIIEPVQGEGGFHVAPPELLRGLREVCSRHGIVLIADEIQSGFARTGRMFAIEHSGVEPDLVTVAKALAGGFPLAGVIGRASIMECVEPGGLGGTYGGSPVGCAAALAVLDVIAEEGLLERADVIGAAIRAQLGRMAEASSTVPIANIRGLGAMLAFDVVRDTTSREPDTAGARAVAARALERGLIILTCGAHGETVRILVPLTIEYELLEQGLTLLEQALRPPSR
jgi:4-aminobutyrate aminotransferase/(S)-3-amino-2-methylpropionate transaminase